MVLILSVGKKVCTHFLVVSSYTKVTISIFSAVGFVVSMALVKFFKARVVASLRDMSSLYSVLNEAVTEVELDPMAVAFHPLQKKL